MARGTWKIKEHGKSNFEKNDQFLTPLQNNLKTYNKKRDANRMYTIPYVHLTQLNKIKETKSELFEHFRLNQHRLKVIYKKVLV